MYSNIKKYFLGVLAIITTIGINMNLEIESIKESFSGNNIIYIVVAILVYMLLKTNKDIEDKRAIKCCFILSIFFSLCEVVGLSICKHNNLSLVLGSKIQLFKASIVALSYTILFYNVLLIIFIRLIPKLKHKKNLNLKFFTNNKKSYILIFFIIFIAYIPFFIHEYPGIISTDVTNEMYTGLYCMNSIVNHHPVFHIIIISIFMNFGKVIGNYNLAIAIFSVCQMLVCALTFSYAIYYMAKKNINTVFRVFTLAFFALYQPFAIYSITLWKDIPFSIMITWFTIGIIEIVTNPEFFKSKKNIFLIFLISILVILFKNNGIYIVIMCIPFIILATKRYRKKAIIFSASIIVAYVMFKGPIFSMFNITDGPIRESLSIPCQQIARAVKYEEISEEDKNSIEQFFPVEEIGESYYPLISDNVKDKLNNEEVKEHKIEFIKIWFKLLCKYPRAYIESFLSGTYGYWYPESKNWVIWGGYSEESWQFAREALNIDISKSPIIEMRGIELLKSISDHREIPVIGMFYSIGFVVWILFIMITYLIYDKKYNLLMAYIPVLGIWLTCLASPVWCEFRYAYALFTTLPILMSLVIKDDKCKEKHNVKKNNGQP